MGLQFLAANEREAHVQAIRLDASEQSRQAYFALLSTEERARALRFRFERDQIRYVLSHGVLRILLAQFTRENPAGIVFIRSAKGKPALFDSSAVRFNMSHSGNLAFYGFTAGCDVGVDIEEMRPILELEDIARRFFSPAETEDLLSLPAEQRSTAFFRCWTRKEAYIKATGDGLSAPLDQFRVSLLPDSLPRILDIQGSAERAARWCLHDFEWATGYISALAYAGPPREIVSGRLITADEVLNFSTFSKSPG